MAYPRIAIVGRPNVGKSSLLNMLAGRRISIVDPTSGVTRDRISCTVELPAMTKGGPTHRVEMIDTGGYGVYSEDETYHVLTEEIERQIHAAVAEAGLILFVIDAQSGLSTLDERVAQLLRREAANRVPVVLVANKADNEALSVEAAEAIRLGFGEPVPVSATTKRNKWELIETITEKMDWTAASEDRAEPEMRLAIVGKRNAGKSTFVNALAGAARVIASELPGTTRDSVDVRFEIEGRAFVAIDTAGVRKRKSVADDVEYYSMHRTLRTVRRADAVLLMIDATEEISQVDKKLAHECEAHFKPTVVVLNKWDRVADRLDPEQYVDYVTDQLRGFSYAPMVFTAARDNDHVREATTMAIDLYEQASQRVGTGQLNEAVRDIMEQRGPSSKLGTRAKVFYVTQVAANPPTIVMFVNDPKLFSDQYQRYLINGFRDRLPFAEVPIKLVIRGRQRRSQPRREAPVVE